MTTLQPASEERNACEEDKRTRPRPPGCRRKGMKHQHLHLPDECTATQMKATDVLAVLSYTTVTGGNMTSVLAGVAESGRHGCCCRSIAGRLMN